MKEERSCRDQVSGRVHVEFFSDFVDECDSFSSISTFFIWFEQRGKDSGCGEEIGGCEKPLRSDFFALRGRDVDVDRHCVAVTGIRRRSEGEVLVGVWWKFARNGATAARGEAISIPHRRRTDACFMGVGVRSDGRRN